MKAGFKLELREQGAWWTASVVPVGVNRKATELARVRSNLADDPAIHAAFIAFASACLESAAKVAGHPIARFRVVTVSDGEAGDT